MKILLGLSGGVDSAVAAYLLKQQGYDVTCCFMRNWDSLANQDINGNPDLNNNICPQETDYNDAKKVASLLELPIIRVDYIEEYWQEVFQNFINEYEKGYTPNPDILCNKYIKFDHFLEYALSNGFDMIATGHYCRVEHNSANSFLIRGLDNNKDQSYFLAQISQKALSKVLFPLGELTKPEVRKIALDLNFSIAEKKDSTGICFIGERNFRQFLNNYLPAQKGKIINIDTNTVVAEHIGISYYTIGQRKGLNIGGLGGPYFVVGKDVGANILFVSNQDSDYWLDSNSCLVEDVNWFNDSELSVTSAKFRYRQKDVAVSLKKLNDDLYLVSYLGAKAVTLGQQAVFYNGDYCLGGGVIKAVFKDGIEIADLISKKRGEK
ncbi:MAG: tRNA 2-thiouridine(34) synthase MnmA [Erysipelotrichaceae bacterium]